MRFAWVDRTSPLQIPADVLLTKGSLMQSWASMLDLQRRSRRNALHAASALHRRRAEADEAQRAAIAAARSSFLDGAHHEQQHGAVSPNLPAIW